MEIVLGSFVVLDRNRAEAKYSSSSEIIRNIFRKPHFQAHGKQEPVQCAARWRWNRMQHFLRLFQRMRSIPCQWNRASETLWEDYLVLKTGGSAFQHEQTFPMPTNTKVTQRAEPVLKFDLRDEASFLHRTRRCSTLTCRTPPYYRSR